MRATSNRTHTPKYRIAAAGQHRPVGKPAHTLASRPAPRKYWTQHDATPGDFLTFLSINGVTTLGDRGPRYSYLNLTPGLRLHLGNNYHFMAGIEMPLTGPKDQSFTYSPIFWFTKVW